jgi:cytochrome P450
MRFYDTNIVAARPNLAFMPFGAGPHRRFGAAMGYLQAQFLLAQIHQRFRIHAVASVANWAAVSVRPGSRTCTSAPSVAWCTCRAPRQASSPRFWPGQR